MKKVLILFMMVPFFATAADVEFNDSDSSEDISDFEIQTPYILQINIPGEQTTYAIPTSMIEEVRGKIKNLIRTKDDYHQDAGALLIVLNPGQGSSRLISTKFNSQFKDDLVAGLIPIKNGSYF